MSAELDAHCCSPRGDPCRPASRGLGEGRDQAADMPKLNKKGHTFVHSGGEGNGLLFPFYSKPSFHTALTLPNPSSSLTPEFILPPESFPETWLKGLQTMLHMFYCNGRSTQ